MSECECKQTIQSFCFLTYIAYFAAVHSEPTVQTYCHQHNFYLSSHGPPYRDWCQVY